MSIKFPQIDQTNPNAPSMAETIRLHQRAGTLKDTVTFHEPKMATSAVPKKVEPADMGFFERTSDDFRALTRGDFSVKDVLREIPRNSVEVPVKIANTVAPAISKFFKTTGSIFGEGLAYAVDKNVREQYRAGNLDILPTITEMTIPKLAKYTIAAGLETAIFRSIPNVAKMKLAQMGGVGAIEGIGFAITEGMAKDESVEEIIKKFPLYGISGGALAVLSPYMLPLLKAEVKHLPGEFRQMFSKVETQIAEESARKLSVGVTTPDWTAVPVSTPNKRYHAYLRSQGYEPYIPDNQLPVIEGGPKVTKSRNDLPNVPEGRVEPVIKTKDLEPPQVSSPKTKAQIEEDYLRSQGYEPYIPDAELPVIQTNKRGPNGSDVKPPAKPVAVVDGPESRYVYDVNSPQKAQADIVAQKPKTVEIKAEDGTTTTYVKTNKAVAVADTTTTPDVKSSATAVEVPSAQMPVGEGAERVSRLEQRMTQSLDNNQTTFIGENSATYQAMSKPDQIRRGAEYVVNNYDDALRVLKGEIEPPEGTLYNSVALAMAKHAEDAGDAQLAVRLASLRATRAGQEISLLTEADPDSVVSALETIIKARKAKVERTTKAGSSSKAVAKTKAEAGEKLAGAKLKMSEVDKVLNDILC